MKTAHIESNKEDIAPIVIMPGDPLRAKYIADTYLENVKIVNQVRNILAYTGYYKNKKVTIFSSGMGIPSIGIYAYELYKFYDVETIIRVGSCGTNKIDIKLLDVILADSAYSLSTFAKLFDNCDDKLIESDKELNDKIEIISKNSNINLKRGSIITSDVFDVYVNQEEYMKNYPEDLNALGLEMEAFALFFLARLLNKKATCLLTVVDSKFDKKELTSEERQNSLDDMIKLALEATL